MERFIRFWREWILGIFAFGFIAFMFYGLCAAITEENKGIASADAAGWAQAIGTFGAIIGALWIAGATERQRKADALTVARVMAATMLFRLSAMNQDTKEALQWFQTTRQVDGEYREFISALELLKKHPKLVGEELAKLAPLPRGCAYQLAAAIDKVNAVIILVDSALNDNRLPTSSDFRKKVANVSAGLLFEATSHFSNAISVIQLQVHGLTSPYQQIHDSLK